MSELPYLSKSQRYRLRLRRKYLRLRALRARFDLRHVQKPQWAVGREDVILFSTFRNEAERLDAFLAHYRDLGVARFVMIDNDSSDNGQAILRDQPDVSIWQTSKSYKNARFGMDWVNYLASRYAAGHWILCVDPDEHLVYPHYETRDIKALTAWLESRGRRSMGAPLIDLYPDAQGQMLFDPYGYRYEVNPRFGNIWMQGGPRARRYFAQYPQKAPALNKIPLVKWRSHYVFNSSTHNLLPRGLNATYHAEGAMLSGALLHYKFTQNFAAKAAEELTRRQHYAQSIEYERYAQNPEAALAYEGSQPYRDWHQLESYGLLSRGAWA